MHNTKSETNYTKMREVRLAFFVSDTNYNFEIGPLHEHFFTVEHFFTCTSYEIVLHDLNWVIKYTCSQQWSASHLHITLDFMFVQLIVKLLKYMPFTYYSSFVEIQLFCVLLTGTLIRLTRCIGWLNSLLYVLAFRIFTSINMTNFFLWDKKYCKMGATLIRGMYTRATPKK